MVNKQRRPFEVPPMTIPANEIKETYNTDVVVAGAGTSGKAAALSAVEAGAKVIQIDKHVTYRWGGGMIGAIDSRLQKEKGVKVDKDDVCLQLMKWGGNKPDQRLYRVWANQSAAVMDWLMDMTDAEGIKTVLSQWPRPKLYREETEYYPDFPVAHVHTDGKTPGLNHKLALNIAQDRALKLGVSIRYETPAVQLIRQPNGRVTGLIARNKAGNFVQFNALCSVFVHPSLFIS